MKKRVFAFVLSFMMMTAWADDIKFTAAEQQQVSIETPGLFDRSDAFEIDLTMIAPNEYSFPLPVGKAMMTQNNSELQISTKKGDAVKAMFSGTVRLSYKHPKLGNIIVVRHDNGLETVYGDNAQNLVKVGDKVHSGQTLAIVGGMGQDCYCTFYVMVNGRKINPSTLLDPDSHKLRKATIKIRKVGNSIKVSSSRYEKPTGLMAYTGEDSFAKSSTVKIDLSQIPASNWCYPLPGAKVISPYGGKRNHAGVDLKTKPNDEIKAAFEGEVIRSGTFSGYGLCIEIKHANGLKTLYSHQSKNLVKVGDKVKAGQTIGLVGRTGRATTEHLHFELHCQGRKYDPAKLYDHANHKLKDIVIQINSSGNITVIK